MYLSTTFKQNLHNMQTGNIDFRILLKTFTSTLGWCRWPVRPHRRPAVRGVVRDPDRQVLGLDGPGRLRSPRLRLLLRRRDAAHDVANCDNGGDHQRHPPAAADHDHHHGGQVDRGPPLPPPLPRAPRVQVHPLPVARAPDHAERRLGAQPRPVHGAGLHDAARQDGQHLRLGAQHLEAAAGLHARRLPRGEVPGRESGEHVLRRDHEAGAQEPHDQTRALHHEVRSAVECDEAPKHF